jgi:dihydrofolate reductase
MADSGKLLAVARSGGTDADGFDSGAERFSRGIPHPHHLGVCSPNLFFSARRSKHSTGQRNSESVVLRFYPQHGHSPLHVKYFKAIAAMSENRVIGAGNRIPWHLPEDFKWFKKMTIGQVIVMGRKTFESIGKPLPNRETIVLSRSDFQHPGVRIVRELSEIDLQSEARDVFICGGAQVYAHALRLCSDLYLTLVKRVVEGDAFFPPFEGQFERSEELQDAADFKIVHYRNTRLIRE